MPFHGGFGLLTLHGIPKPTYRAFELLHRLGDERLPVEGTHETVDAWAVRGGNELVGPADQPRPAAAAHRAAARDGRGGGRAGARAVTLERIDEDHANAKAEWQRMGSPEYLKREDVERLEEASRLHKGVQPWRYEEGTLTLEVTLPAHAVAAVTIDFVPEPQAA